MKKCKSSTKGILSGVLTAVLVSAVLLCFFTALHSVGSGQSTQGRQQLETALRRSAVACYAVEGIYPPTLSYLEEHYGVQIDEQHYTVFYEIFADNLIPEITVLERIS